MSNIMDYLNWRGDLTFKQDGINEVDTIILARFSYLPFKDIDLEKIDSIENIANKMKDLSIDKFIWKDDKEFIIKLGKTKRYKVGEKQFLLCMYNYFKYIIQENY